ncbi:TetR/AcrR family transcriptional regulator [Corynebacterium hansenii]|uniref:TetR/AcrR family transcriptional regulator n=1 Tax=Corynebacterium hansenii TaxID=394964 RepID=A0ABV7ZP64_9CORY|nr:TetR/AcrR family transcriptional regulator [Corynebacterium hansenii]WJZ00644.1 HTH-type transcriptional repressor KstR2 [Corynebacterium hansenii]
MSGPERRRQLLDIGRATFAERGLDGTSMEEIASRAGVSKPVVYEHFGTKDGLYREVVAEEMERLERVIAESISKGRSRARIERAVIGLLTYVEEHTDGFTILARDPGSNTGLATLLGNATGRVSHILGAAFTRAGLDEAPAVLYSQALVGMVSQTAQWWLDERTGDGAGGEQTPARTPDGEPLDRETVAAHIVNLCWNGLAGMEAHPVLRGDVEGPAAEEGAVFGAGPEADPADRVRREGRRG